MKFIAGFVVIGALATIEANDGANKPLSKSEPNNNCLSSSQVDSAVHALSSVENDWSTLASKSKSDLSTKAKLEDLDKLLANIDSKNKLLKSMDNDTPCLTDADSETLQSSSANLLDVVRKNLAHFYDLAKAAMSENTSKSDSAAIASPEIDARRQRGGRGGYEPVYQYPPGYVPAYQPAPQGYQPAYEPQVTGYYQPGGYPQPAPAQGGSSPRYTPDTGGYQYQGGDEDDSKQNSGPRNTPEQPSERNEGQPYYQPDYQPAYQPAYYQPQPQESNTSDPQPDLNDKDGNFILKFAEHLTETLLYQLEVIGYEFGGGRNRKQSKSLSLVSDTKDKVLSYASEIIGN